MDTNAEHSSQYYVLKERWEQGRITEVMLRRYVVAGRITAAEFKEITGKDY